MNNKITIIMPCLNEEKTVGKCIDDAFNKIKELDIDADVLIIDNGSTDRSAEIALKHGAKVITETKKGYGSALKTGIKEADSKYIIMLDCDRSYRLDNLNKFIEYFDKGYDLVVGDRFGGDIEKGAMSLSHKIGNTILSKLGKIISKSNANDLYCGLRGFNKEKIEKLNLQHDDMIFAHEMIVKASKAHYKIANVVITLYKDERNGKSHLNTIRDGFKTLNYLLSEA